MISILLSSYNGEKYITEQIDSLLNQTVQDFKLYICDDKSTDTTFSIILKYAENHRTKIITMHNKVNSGGAKHNFMKMIIAHKDDYVMLCDQDDVWMSNKIEKSLNKIKEMEEAYGSSMPLLVHSDLRVVDNNLNVIADSYEKMAYTCFAKNALRNIVQMNIAAGCTIMFNRALADLIQDEPDFFVVHDWWLTLVAAAFGRIGTIYEPTILYRQHGENDIGAKKILSFGYIVYVLSHTGIMTAKINDSHRQAESFLNLYRDKLSESQKELLNAYALIPQLSKIKKLQTKIKYKTFRYGFARKIAEIMILLIERRIIK